MGGARTTLNQSVGSEVQRIGKLLALEDDLSSIEQVLVGRPECVQYAEGRRQLATATFAASVGLYNLAYAGLRIFLELSFAAAFFSAHELERRQWLADRADFSWSRAIDPDTGVLSKSFVREFTPIAADEAVDARNVAKRVYRECSQHLHGKAIATESMPKQIEFDSQALSVWLELADDAAQSVLFLLYSRYGGDYLPSSPIFAQIAEARLAHLLSVQQYLGMI
jgi:hypothetical protein